MGNQSPLSKFYRSIKFYIELPSGTNYYTDNEVEFTDSGELGIMAMTSKDELLLKNPDGLLNGESIIGIIKSCVPGVKQPKALLCNDLDVLMIAIRYATYGDDMSIDIECPACGHENHYTLNLGQNLDHIGKLDSDYVVHLEQGLTVFVKPFTLVESMKALREQFEQSKITKSLGNEDISEEERLKMFSSAFTHIAELTFDLCVSSIIKIVKEDEDICVTDKAQIKEFIFNIDKLSAEAINNKIKEINDIGITKRFSAACTNCAHQWETPIDFNPTNFF